MEETDAAEFDWLKAVTTNSGAEGNPIGTRDFPPSVLANIEKRMSASASQMSVPTPPTAPPPPSPPQQQQQPSSVPADGQQSVYAFQQQQQLQLMQQQLQQQQLLNYQMQHYQQMASMQMPAQNMMMYQPAQQMMMTPNGQMMMVPQGAMAGYPSMGMMAQQQQPMMQAIQTPQGIQWVPMLPQQQAYVPHGAMGGVPVAQHAPWTAVQQQAVLMQNKPVPAPPPPPMPHQFPPPPFGKQQPQRPQMAPPPPPPRQYVAGAASAGPQQAAPRLPASASYEVGRSRGSGAGTPIISPVLGLTPRSQAASVQRDAPPAETHTMHCHSHQGTVSPGLSPHRGVLSIDSPEMRPKGHNVDAAPFVPGRELPPVVSTAGDASDDANPEEGPSEGDGLPQTTDKSSCIEGIVENGANDGDQARSDASEQSCHDGAPEGEHVSDQQVPPTNDALPPHATLGQSSARTSLSGSGISPPMALGVDDDLPAPAAQPPYQPPPSYGSATASSVHPSNPTFAIPPRCVSKQVDGKTSFKCPYCSDKGFLSEYVLRSHLRAKHVTDASFLVRPSVADAIAPLVMDYLAVDGPASGGSAPLTDVVQCLPLDIAGDIRDATHFEALLGTKDDFVVFQYTEEELQLHQISSDVATSKELRVALLGAPYVKVDIARSTAN